MQFNFETCHFGDDLNLHFFVMVLVCADLIKGAKDKQLKVKGPVRMPTKVCIHTSVHLQFYAQ